MTFEVSWLQSRGEGTFQGELQGTGGGGHRYVLELFSHRVLCNTTFMRLSCQKAKDGDVLMLACQKITAQMFSAKSNTSMAGETVMERAKKQ